jgi:hypothetical protein
LRANKADIKVTQELLRHASSRVTLDTYTQAVTVQKRRSQSSVVRLLQASIRVLAESGLLGIVRILCLLEMARSVRQYLFFNDVHPRCRHELCLFCACVKEQDNCKLLKEFGVPDGI